MSRNTIGHLIGSALLCGGLLFGLAASTARAQMLEWVRQLGSSDFDGSLAVSADGLGNVYISGVTTGSLDGPNAGLSDAFVRKYDAAGNIQWTRQLGTGRNEDCWGVSADGLGSVYISGATDGMLGGPPRGSDDAFVSKYNAGGELHWTRRLGTVGDDAARGVSADGLGNVYIAGFIGGCLSELCGGSNDAFVSKYDAVGNLQWAREIGTPEKFDFGFGVSADGLGNVYIAGATDGSLSGPNAGDTDAFVGKYDAAGNLQWTRQLGTGANDQGLGVSADGLGNVFISGVTFGSLSGPDAGEADAFVSRYDASGNLQWTRQLGTAEREICMGVSADGLGNVYITGRTEGSLGGPNAGGADAFVSKYDAMGALQWTRQLGTAAFDVSYGVSADESGTVYISGATEGSLGAPNAGGQDAFLAKFVIPEPGSWRLAALISSAVLWIRKQRN